jgi:hypothetical protein
MRQFFLGVIALIISATLAHSQEFSVAQTDDVDAMLYLSGRLIFHLTERGGVLKLLCTADQQC